MNKLMQVKSSLLLLFLAFFLTSPIYAEEKDYLLSPLPDSWQLEQQYFQTLPCDDAWWNTFNDTVLTELIRMAIANNFNVASALKRIEMASKEIGIARSGYYPTISLTSLHPFLSLITLPNVNNTKNN